MKDYYADYPEKPYISSERDMQKWEDQLKNDSATLVPRRNMERTEEGLLPGDIILLWRIQLGTFTTDSWYPKYFEYTYGIDAPTRLQDLLEDKYAQIDSAAESMDHVTAKALKNILKEHGQKGYSSLKKAELEQRVLKEIPEEDLDKAFKVRGISLTAKGEKAVQNNQAVLDRHPMKAMYK